MVERKELGIMPLIGQFINIKNRTTWFKILRIKE